MEREKVDKVIPIKICFKKPRCVSSYPSTSNLLPYVNIPFHFSIISCSSVPSQALNSQLFRLKFGCYFQLQFFNLTYQSLPTLDHGTQMGQTQVLQFEGCTLGPRLWSAKRAILLPKEHTSLPHRIFHQPGQNFTSIRQIPFFAQSPQLQSLAWWFLFQAQGLDPYKCIHT